MRERLNFSPKPFKSRGLFHLILWLANALALAALVYAGVHWWGLRERNASAHEQIDGISGEQGQLEDRYTEMVARLDQIDLKTYNRRMDQFFSIQRSLQTHWGMLLDDLADILPPNVRVVSLRTAGGGREDDSVTNLRMEGEARDKASQLSFIEALQKHPSFEHVAFDLERYEGEQVAFEIRFAYAPGGGAQ